MRAQHVRRRNNWLFLLAKIIISYMQDNQLGRLRLCNGYIDSRARNADTLARVEKPSVPVRYRGSYRGMCLDEHDG